MWLNAFLIYIDPFRNKRTYLTLLMLHKINASFGCSFFLGENLHSTSGFYPTQTVYSRELSLREQT